MTRCIFLWLNSSWKHSEPFLGQSIRYLTICIFYELFRSFLVKDRRQNHRQLISLVTTVNILSLNSNLRINDKHMLLTAKNIYKLLLYFSNIYLFVFFFFLIFFFVGRGVQIKVIDFFDLSLVCFGLFFSMAYKPLLAI